MFQYIFKKLEPYIDTLITDRIIKFHDRMVDDGQIKPLKPSGVVREEPVSRCTEG